MNKRYILAGSVGLVVLFLLGAVIGLLGRGNNTPYAAWWLPFWIVLFTSSIGAYYSRQTAFRIQRKRRKGVKIMIEALQAFVGKRCEIIISGYGASKVNGVVMSAQDNWMAVKTGKPGNETVAMVNADYIMRIQEKR